MKGTALLLLLILTDGLWAQDAIPAGTILPVRLNSSLKSNKAQSGATISARLMQDVPLSEGMKIRAGAKIIGHVIAATPAHDRRGGEISLRFDTVMEGGQHMPVVTNLRAIAGMMEVSEAQVPENGPDRGTSENNWTTNQVGGEDNYHNGFVSNGALTVGRSVPDGVLVRPRTKEGSQCRGDLSGNGQLQAMWVFASDACGIYGINDLTLVSAGRTDPMGKIVFRSGKGNVNIRSGSGILLRVNRPQH